MNWTQLRLVLPGLLAMILAVLAVAACSSGATPAPTAAASVPPPRKVAVEGSGSYIDVSVAGLAAMLKNKDFPLINVHIPYEGEIERTDRHIPYNQIEAHLDQLPADKNARIVLYCRSGAMSAIAARALVKQGYTSVWNLDGGMVAWKDAGYALLNKPQ